MKKALFKTMALVVVFVLAFSFTGFTAFAENSNTVDGFAVLSESPAPEESAAPTESVEPSEDPEPTESVEPSEDPEPTESVEPSEDPEPTESAEPSEDPEPTESAAPEESPEPSESPAPEESPAPSESPSLTTMAMEPMIFGYKHLHTSAEANGTLDNDLDGWYQNGSQVNLMTALPRATTEGYEFKYWEEATGNWPFWQWVYTDPIITVGDLNEYRAIFGLQQFTVTFMDYDGTTVLKTETVDYGTGATAPPDPTRTGYTFSGWDTDFSHVTSPLTVTATYTPNQYTITFEENGGTPVADITQDYDYVVTNEPSTSKTGFLFEGWYTDDGTFNNKVTFPYTIKGNATFYAKWSCGTFTVENKDPGTGTGPGAGTVDVYYNGSFVTNLAPGGEVNIDYVSGVDTVQCQAIPTSESTFNKWNEVSTDKFANPRSFDIPVTDCPMVVEVHPQWFEADKYLIDTTVTNGTIDPDVYVYEGQNKTINYSADTGYHLDSVTVDGVDVTATSPTSYTFTNVQANHTIEVVYAIDTFMIDTTVTNGTINPVDPTVNCGGNQTITYMATTGYHLDSVTVDGVDVTATNPDSYTFTNVQANHEIEVVYAIDTFFIDTIVVGGTIDPVDPTVDYGASQTITYSADTGYSLESVTVDGINVTATSPTSYEFTNVQSNHEIEVVYVADTYTIDTTVTNGTIDPVDPTVNHGASQTITYSADTGYHLEIVAVDGTDVTATNPTSYTFTDVQANHEIVVVYAIDTFTIDTTVTNGTIDPVDPTVNYGASQTITYSADTGYHLDSVTVDGVDVTATSPSSYTFTNVQANHTIEVVYAIDTFTIDTTVTGGTIDPVDPTVDYGGSQTITYSADAHYHLASVTVDGVDVTATNPLSYTFTDVQANHAIEVVYEIDTFTVYTVVTNGTADPMNPVVNYGDSPRIQFSPNTGYHLESITANGLPIPISGIPDTFNLTICNVQEDWTIEVVYAIDTFTIDTTVTNGTIDPVDPTVNYGGSQTITYSADTGYHLESVTVDGVDVTATNPTSYEFTNVDDNHTIEVVYAIDTFTIDTTVTNGTIDPVDPTVNYGGSQTITYSADTGYHLESVTVDGVDVTATYPTSYEFTNVQANHEIEVVYAIDTFTIDTTVTNGTIDPVDPTVNYGGSQTISYSADTGYSLVSVTVDGVDVTATYPTSYEFTNVDDNHTIEVVYAAIVYNITYDLDGGTNDPGNPSTYTVEDPTITLADPTKDGYTFLGWEPTDSIPAGSTGDKTFTATWSDPIAYDITYVLDGGTNDPSNPSTYTVEDDTITLAAPTKDGYTFLGWEPTDNIPAGSTGDKTFTATWSDPIVYSITYNLDGGTNDPANPSTYTVEDETIELAAPTRSGYNFNGWTPTGSIPTGSTGDKTFTASWTSAAPTAFLVRFVDFDGTLLSAQWVHAGNGATAPASPTRDGFTFAGWDVPFSNITGPLTVTATYTPVATPVTPAVVPEVIPEEEVPEAAPSAEPEVTPTPAPEVIEEEEVPEAAPGIAWALLNLILAIAGAIMAVVLIVGYFTRKKQEEEGGQRYNIKRRGVARFLSLIPGIGGIIAFLLTEPWWVANIVFTDMWTWLMIVIFAAQVAVAILARKKREEEDGQTPARA